MPELIIKYSSQKTLQILIDLAKYFDFEIAKPATSTQRKVFINGVPLISGDETVDGLFREKEIIHLHKLRVPDKVTDKQKK